MKQNIYKPIFYSYFVLTLLYLFRMNTTWEPYDSIASLFKYISLLLIPLILGLSLQRYNPHNLIILFLVGLVVLVVGINCDQIIPLVLSYVLIIGAKDIDFRDIVKIHFLVSFMFCIFNMTVSELGLTKKIYSMISDEREGLFGDDVVRKDFGYGWSTDYAIHVFFILLDYWIIKLGKLRLLEYLIYISIGIFIILETDSRMAAASILLLCLWAMYLNRVSALSRIASKILVYSVPLCALISVLATITYDSSDILWMGADLLFSGRLHLGHNAIQEEGIPLLGQAYKMYGAGNAGMGDTEYNFLDCAYIQSLVVWGSLLTIIWIISFVLISRNAANRKDHVLVVAVFLSAVAGIIAPYSCNLKYCILLLALVASHKPSPILKRNYGTR